VSQWCQYEGCFDNKVTPESRSRGFGPGGVRTEKIRKLCGQIVESMTCDDPWPSEQRCLFQKLADMLLADVVKP
jgi:hypothetical protein